MSCIIPIIIATFLHLEMAYSMQSGQFCIEKPGLLRILFKKIISRTINGSNSLVNNCSTYVHK